LIESLVQTNTVVGGQSPAQYDAQVQETLDAYWPGTTDLQNLSREWPGKAVYTAEYDDQEVIIKSNSYYNPAVPGVTAVPVIERTGAFVNYIGETVPVSGYFDPVVESSKGASNKKYMYLT